jgi:Tol biopolymer transport system component
MPQEENNRLDSWKSISEYLGKDVTTLIRWEKERGLPVHRTPGPKRSAIFAYKDEIDQWLRSGSGPGSRDSGIGTLDPGLETRGSGFEDRGPGIATRDLGFRHRDSGSAASESGAGRRKLTANDPVAGGGTQRWQDVGATGVGSEQGRQDGGATKQQAAQAEPLLRSWMLFTLLTAAGVMLGIRFLLPRRRESASPMQWAQVTHDGYEKPREFPLLTDGPRLYFEESVNDHRVIATVPASGGETTILSTPGGLYLSDLSLNGADLILAGELPGEHGRRLWTCSPSGSTVESLDGLMGGNASWSPDGSRILFARGNAMYIAAADGRGARKLTDTGDGPHWIRWSPDGKILRSTVQEPRAQLETIWQVSADGRNSHQFLPDWSRGKYVCCGNWTADGRYFVFQATVNDRTDIWAVQERQPFIRLRKQQPVRITSGPMKYYSPLPGPDGKRLFVIGERPRAELMQLDMKSHHFVEFLSGISATDVSFSRDGKWVAYVTYPDYHLWRRRADGSDARQLTFGNMTADDPEWSPDGKQIAFLGVTKGPRYKAYVVPADAGAVRPFIPGPSEQGVASWSPDGKSIVFGGLLHRKPDSQMAIHVLNLSTHQLTTLPGSQGLWTARWSPDGRYIAALSCQDEKHLSPSLWLYNVRTRKWTVVARVNWINEPSWTRDSQYVYFGTPGDPINPALYCVRVSDHELERLAGLKPNAEGENWTGVTPDGSPLIARNAASQEIYALDWTLGR